MLKTLQSRTLYKLLCWSVTLLKFLPKSYQNCIIAPAHLYATEVVVYTALFCHFWTPPAEVVTRCAPVVWYPLINTILHYYVNTVLFLRTVAIGHKNAIF